MALILCPRCRHLLGQDDPHRQPCRNCGGVFVRREAINPLLEELRSATGGVLMLSPYRSPPPNARRRPAPPPPEASPRYMACPHCSKRMNRITVFADFRIVVDMCINHGVWFDSGEIEHATDHLQAQSSPLDGPEPTPEQQVATLIDHYFGGAGEGSTAAPGKTEPTS